MVLDQPLALGMDLGQLPAWANVGASSLHCHHGAGSTTGDWSGYKLPLAGPRRRIA